MIKANFNTYNNYVTDSLYQWDLNQDLIINGLNLSVAPEIHFANANMDRAIVRQSTLSSGVVTVRIPNSLLQEALTIKAYVGVYEDTTFTVIETIEIPVIAKARPSDYALTDTDEEIYSFNRLENEIVNAKKNIADQCDDNLVEMKASIEKKTKTLSAQVANIVAHNNDTEGNTELTDIRVGADGTVHASAGEAVRSQVSQLSEENTELKGDLDNKVIKTIGRNKFNKNGENVDDYYITVLNDSEKIVSYNGVSYSEKIKVNGNDTIVFTDNSMVRTNRGIVYCSDGTVIALTSVTTAYNSTYAIATMPSNAESVRFNYITDNIDTIFFGFNKYPEINGKNVFVPYAEHIRLKTKYNFDTLNIVVAGDSIMRGYGNNNIGALEIIEDMYGGNVVNIAVSGARLVTDTTLLDERYSITNGILQTDFTNVDYLILDGGYNDTAHGKNGSVTDFYEETEENQWDGMTACSGLEKIFHYMAKNYPNTKILYVFPTAIGIDSWRSETRFYGNIIDVLEKWSIDYLDLFKVSQAIGNFSNTLELYYYNSDGTHPNELGYKRFYVQAIAKWIYENQENY